MLTKIKKLELYYAQKIYDAITQNQSLCEIYKNETIQHKKIKIHHSDHLPDNVILYIQNDKVINIQVL